VSKGTPEHPPYPHPSIKGGFWVGPSTEPQARGVPRPPPGAAGTTPGWRNPPGAANIAGDPHCSPKTHPREPLSAPHLEQEKLPGRGPGEGTRGGDPGGSAAAEAKAGGGRAAAGSETVAIGIARRRGTDLRGILIPPSRRAGQGPGRGHGAGGRGSWSRGARAGDNPTRLGTAEPPEPVNTPRGPRLLEPPRGWVINPSPAPSPIIYSLAGLITDMAST